MTDPYRSGLDPDAEEVAWQWLDWAIEHSWNDPDLAYDLALIAWHGARRLGFYGVAAAADAYLAVLL